MAKDKPKDLFQKQTCLDCQFWAEPTKDFGQCRRYPPTGVSRIVEGGPLGLPLVTPADYWCGEFKARAGRA